MAVHFGDHTYFPGHSRTDRRNGYQIALIGCKDTITFALRSCKAAQLPIEPVQDMLTDVINLDLAACQFGDSSEWTYETELECLRILGRASALAARVATHVETGCVAGASAAIMANDPSVAVAASVCAVSLSRSRSRERNVGERIPPPSFVQNLSRIRSRSRERHDVPTSSTPPHMPSWDSS